MSKHWDRCIEKPNYLLPPSGIHENQCLNLSQSFSLAVTESVMDQRGAQISNTVTLTTFNLKLFKQQNTGTQTQHKA